MQSLQAAEQGAFHPSRTRERLVLAAFTLTLFLSAVLMFAVQPMTGKMLLPLVGGTPAGWIVAMAFFQVMLLGGYLYAHALTRFSPRLHGMLYTAALLAGCLFLPLKLPPAGTETLGAVDVFLLLGKTLALPFVALSATSSTLQRLFTATGHRLAPDPYFLYAGSNLGSFTGLLLYPLAFERNWGLQLQSHYWFDAYALLIAASLLCLSFAAADPARAAAGETPAGTRPAAHASVTGRQRLEWCALAFFPSALLLAVTTHISTDIFSAPLLWVLPLSLYLLTFVAAFAKKRLLPVERLARLQPVTVMVALGFLMMFTAAVRLSWQAVAVQLFAFTVTALMCHGLLADRRPLEKDGGNGTGQKSRLTEFYLMISLGGALGGVLNAFVFPAVLNRLIEYPLLLCLSLLLNPAVRARASLQSRMFFGLASFCAFTYVCYVLRGGWSFVNALGPDFATGFADVMLFVTLLLLATGPRSALLGGLIMVLLAEFVIPGQLVLARRDFYGVLKIYDFPMDIGDKTYTARYLYHGTTTHGMQIRSPKYAGTPTTYYTRGGPVDDIFRLYKPKDVAVLGLGAGTMNCYATKENSLTFFEIDPEVVAIASDPKTFTFLSSCGTGRSPRVISPRIITGDGRLELAKLRGKFDLIVLDAFSSDTIPSHLLTTEAIRIYLDHLQSGGLLLFNLSNRYFDLGSALSRNAVELGLSYRFRLDVPDGTLPYASASKWFVMARPAPWNNQAPKAPARHVPFDGKAWDGKARSAPLSKLDSAEWITLPPPENLRPWTDDDTDLLSVLELSRLQLSQLQQGVSRP